MKTPRGGGGVSVKMDVKGGGVATIVHLPAFICKKKMSVIWSNLMIQITATLLFIYLLYFTCQIYNAMVVFLWMCCK